MKLCGFQNGFHCLQINLQFSRNHSFHSYNTRRHEDIHPSRPKLSLGKRTFRYSGVILFNSLPETYKRAASLEAFKRLLMKHDLA